MGWVAGQKCTRGYTLQSGPEGPSWCRGVGVGRFRTTMHQTCILTASLTTAAVYSSDALLHAASASRGHGHGHGGVCHKQDEANGASLEQLPVDLSRFRGLCTHAWRVREPCRCDM